MPFGLVDLAYALVGGLDLYRRGTGRAVGR